MKWLVGLGNPGREYEKTRHNVGFRVIDRLSGKCGIPLKMTKWQALLGEGKIDGEKFLLVKPLTYMNRSGEAVQKVLHWYKLSLEELLVVYDDLDLPVGKLRLREKGSAGGHNGMKSIIAHLGSDSFKRIRIGIGRPPEGMQVPDYVLSPFSKGESALVDQSLAKAAEAVRLWAKTPFAQVMNQYNQANE